MFYLIETKNQLNQLESNLSSSLTRYLEFIQGNDNTHPALAEIIAIYLEVDGEDFIIPLNHLECINWGSSKSVRSHFPTARTTCFPFGRSMKSYQSQYLVLL